VLVAHPQNFPPALLIGMADEKAANDQRHQPDGSPHAAASTAAEANLPEATLEQGQDDAIEADVR